MTRFEQQADDQAPFPGNWKDLLGIDVLDVARGLHTNRIPLGLLRGIRNIHAGLS